MEKLLSHLRDVFFFVEKYGTHFNNLRNAFRLTYIHSLVYHRCNRYIEEGRTNFLKAQYTCFYDAQTPDGASFLFLIF